MNRALFLFSQLFEFDNTVQEIVQNQGTHGTYRLMRFELPAHVSVRYSQQRMIEFIRHNPHVARIAQTDHQLSALALATKFLCEDVIAELLRQGASTETPASVAGPSILARAFAPFDAALEGWGSMSQLCARIGRVTNRLLQAGAQPNVREPRPLHLAVTNACVDATRFLLEAGAEITKSVVQNAPAVNARMRRQAILLHVMVDGFKRKTFVVERGSPNAAKLARFLNLAASLSDDLVYKMIADHMTKRLPVNLPPEARAHETALVQQIAQNVHSDLVRSSRKPCPLVGAYRFCGPGAVQAEERDFWEALRTASSRASPARGGTTSRRLPDDFGHLLAAASEQTSRRLPDDVVRVLAAPPSERARQLLLRSPDWPRAPAAVPATVAEARGVPRASSTRTATRPERLQAALQTQTQQDYDWEGGPFRNL